MGHSLTRKRSTPSLSNKQSESVSFRDGKNPAVRSLLYEKTLAANDIFMDDDGEVDPTAASKTLCQTMLNTEHTVLKDSIFRPDIFKLTCQRIRRRNEAMVLVDITPLIVARAEILYTYGASHLKHLTEEFNAAWYKCFPLVKGPNPQPDYSVGFKDSAFSRSQLKKLEPFVGSFQPGHFMATEWMHFPFLTCEVKCGNEALNIADRQNAHSASVAVNAVVELYRAVSRQDELHREILAFSVSHDNEAVRIYGHYALINGKETSFYRHPIKKFDFTSEDGKDKWTAYKFTRSVYDTFVPLHLNRIQTAVDQLPDPEIFLVEPLSQHSHVEPFEQDDSQSTPSYSQGSASRLPSSQTTEPVFKKPKGRGAGFEKNRQDSPFLNLPPEIRNRIYEWVLGNQIIEVDIRPNRKNEDGTWKIRNPADRLSYGRYDGARPEGTKRTNDTERCSSCRDLTLPLRTCRQVYLETAALPFSLNVFRFYNEWIFRLWLKRCRAAQRQAIRRVCVNFILSPANMTSLLPRLRVVYYSNRPEISPDEDSCWIDWWKGQATLVALEQDSGLNF